jgi:hypothetical protein
MDNHAVFIDVDGTLERRTLGFKRSSEPMVRAIRKLHEDGARIYVWSSAGGDHAREAAEKAGIAALCAGFLPKPNILVDDKRPSRWKDCKLLSPSDVARGRAG